MALIVKENGRYILRDKNEDLILGWDGKDKIVTTKVWEKNQIFAYKLRWLGSVAINDSLLRFGLAEGKTSVLINYKKGDMTGTIRCDIDKWLAVGEDYHDSKTPYDNQLVLPRKTLLESLDDTGKKIYDEIWQDKKPEIEQAYKLKNQEFTPIDEEDLKKWII